MITIESKYLGNLRTQAKHLQSGNEVITDAPLDNQGQGKAFSPTDLMSASLGSCMLTIMGIAARTHDFNIDGTKINITKVMASNPRRVAEIKIEFFMPEMHFSDHHKMILMKAAQTCPVALSLHPDLLQTLSFNWAE